MAKAKQTSVPCDFGPAAVNGDYVVTLHRYGYQGKEARALAGRVWDGKVYTGVRDVKGKDVHKLSAIVIINPSLLTQKQKDRIQADMADHLKEFTAPPATLDRYLERTYIDHIDKVWAAFELCQNEEDIKKLIDRLHYGYGGTFGEFSYTVTEEGETFNVLNSYEEYGELHQEDYDFSFYDPDMEEDDDDPDDPEDWKKVRIPV